VELAISFLMVLVLSSHLDAQASPGKPAPDESKLIALENAWNLAQLQHDSKALDQLVGDRFVYTDYDGTVMNKAQFLADIRNPSYKASLMTNENMRVFLYADAAVVIGTYHAKGTADGKAFDHTGRFTDTWILHQNQWQCVASHTNLLQK
jgi:ketosteroid isomerase-like protein